MVCQTIVNVLANLSSKHLLWPTTGGEGVARANLFVRIGGDCGWRCCQHLGGRRRTLSAENHGLVWSSVQLTQMITRTAELDAVRTSCSSARTPGFANAALPECPECRPDVASGRSSARRRPPSELSHSGRECDAKPFRGRL